MGNKTWNLQRALHQLKNFDHVLDVQGGGVLMTHRGHRDRLSLLASFNREGARVENDYPLTIQGLRTAFKAMGSEDYSFEIRK